MKVSVEVPARVFGALADRADATGVKMSALLADALTDAVEDLIGDVLVDRASTHRGRISDADVESMRAMRDGGMGWDRVAVELGVSVTTVYRAARRAGLMRARA